MFAVRCSSLVRRGFKDITPPCQSTKRIFFKKTSHRGFE
jgi:hypothetical protein